MSEITHLGTCDGGVEHLECNPPQPDSTYRVEFWDINQTIAIGFLAGSVAGSNIPSVGGGGPQGENNDADVFGGSDPLSGDGPTEEGPGGGPDPCPDCEGGSPENTTNTSGSSGPIDTPSSEGNQRSRSTGFNIFPE